MTVAVSPQPEVVSQCACCHSEHTQESFEKLALVRSSTHPSGRMQHDGATYEFRRCDCSNTLVVRQ